MGTDVRSMTAQTLSIYANPAVIAINQDPLGQAAHRQWRYQVEDVDEYGQGEISLWVGGLSGGDFLFALINGGNNSRMMNATLTELFWDQSTSLTSGLSPMIQETWDVYDLWANRMSNVNAQAIINGTATMNGTITDSANSTTRYNSTQMSYADGLGMHDTALMGSKVASILPMGIFTAEIPRHGIGLYRIRSQGAIVRKRDEL